MGRFRTLEHEFDGTSAVFEEEKIAKEDLFRLCQKAEADANFWRLKFEQDGIAKIEELEHTKLKLQARLAECENTVDNLSTKLDSLEKVCLQCLYLDDSCLFTFLFAEQGKTSI